MQLGVESSFGYILQKFKKLDTLVHENVTYVASLNNIFKGNSQMLAGEKLQKAKDGERNESRRLHH